MTNERKPDDSQSEQPTRRISVTTQMGQLSVDGPSGGGVLKWNSEKGIKQQDVKPRVYDLALREFLGIGDTQKKSTKTRRQTVDVVFDLEGGKPINLRLPSGSNLPPNPPIGQTESGTVTALTRQTGFINPYNFITALDRSVLATKPQSTGLEDQRPCGHHRYFEQRFTGWIDVELKVATPLLIPDPESEEIRSIPIDDEKHKNHSSFSIRKRADGTPDLPSTSIKGVLSAAYEAVTNSRLRIFQNHASPLGKRMDPKAGLQLVPARVSNGRIVLLPGMSEIGPDGKPTKGAPLYAAWLRMYRGLSRDWGSLAKHKKCVWAYVTLWRHKNFTFWNVVELADGSLPRPETQPKETRKPSSRMEPSNGTGQWVLGYVFISGQNFDRKHDERVFFTTRSDGGIDAGSCDTISKQWRDLITNYQGIHRDEIEVKRMAGPPALEDSGWSRHVTAGPAAGLNQSERNLDEGTLFYTRVEKTREGKYRVLDAYPVNISRALFPRSPQDLLNNQPTLAPAASLDQLSPADRVFGWVASDANDVRSSNTDAEVAYRGQIRILRVESQPPEGNASAIEQLGGDGVPLSILSTPKPSLASFYVNDGSQPVKKKNDGYADNQTLRHRKVYPHHKQVSGDVAYWSTENAKADLTQDHNFASAHGGSHQEYRRPGDADTSRDDQNRSMREWVKIGTTFRFRIQVTNLSSVELGGLLWLLSLNGDPSRPEFFLRMGGGKPLGFGSVSAAVTASDLRDGNDWKKYYLSFDDIEINSEQQLRLRAAMIDQYQKAIVLAYGDFGDRFEKVSFIDAFLAAAKGFADFPVHYPRMSKTPDAAGENFKWFVEAQRSLTDVGLPVLTTAGPPVLPYGDSVVSASEKEK